MTSSNVSNVSALQSQPVRGKKSNSKDQTDSLEFYNMMQSSMTKGMLSAGAKGSDKSIAVSAGNPKDASTDSFAVGTPVKTEKPGGAAADKSRDNSGAVSQKADAKAGAKKNVTSADNGKAAKDTSGAGEELSEEEEAVIEEALSNFKEQLTDLFTESFDISEEELAETMSEMGLAFSDLLLPENLTALITELGGNEDPSAILTMEGGKELLDSFANISIELASNLGEDTEFLTLKSVETGISVTELQSMGMELAEGSETFEMPKNGADIQAVPQKDITDIPAEKSEEVVVAEDPLKKEAISMSSEKEEDDKLPEIKDDIQELSAEEAPVEKSDTAPKQNLSQQGNGGNTNTGKNPMTQETGRADNLQNNVNMQPQAEPQVQTETTTQVKSYTSIDTRDIIEQVVTAARTNITDSVRSVELELNPHNLGKMLMQVTEREGEVSARLIAENQSVKEALETQLANLRDRLNEQGIKVTSVEVTVSTHEFEQNLEQGQTGQAFEEGRNEERREEARNTANSRGGIDLGDGSDLSELTEEEALEASMMADAGNRMSLRA